MIDDVYCDRCGVVGHEYVSAACPIYGSSAEAPFGKKMRSLEGTVMKIVDLPPAMWPRNTSAMLDDYDDLAALKPGTFVRVIKYTPWQNRMESGNNFLVEKLNDKYSGAQVHPNKLLPLDALERLSLIKDEVAGGPRIGGQQCAESSECYDDE